MEHVTNVSDNETPELVTDIKEWIQHEPKENLEKFGIDADRFHEYMVLPRLLFGKYLADQFKYLRRAAKPNGVEIVVHFKTEVVDIIDVPGQNETQVVTQEKQALSFDHVIICTGHRWPTTHEGIVPGYFDSPYPPAKLNLKLNHAVAIRGASLSAIDAIKTIARNNGTFARKDGRITYTLFEESSEFKIIMHSRNGLLPAFRFHLENTSPSSRTMLSEKEVLEMRESNEGFLSLDDVFERKYKQPLKNNDPEFYDEIEKMSLEEFTQFMMERREQTDPFALFKAEFREAEKSIKRRASIHWKEALAELSFILNYPAKYLSAEDMLRLQKVLMPLISVVIAFIPQNSGEELMALHEAGVLSLKTVGNRSEVVAQQNGGATYYMDESTDSHYFKTFIDCVGQPHFHFEDFPFKSLVDQQVVTGARLKFKSATKGAELLADNEEHIEADRDGALYLKLPGIAINDFFQVVDKYGSASSRIFVMAVPFISGFNPDYSGLDFCERASAIIVNQVIQMGNGVK